MGYGFISYSHADMDIVFKAIDYLQANGIELWYDLGIEEGEEWPEKIGKALFECSYMLVFMSPTADNSQNCRNEINMGLKLKKPMLIVYLEEFQLSYGMMLQIDTIQSVRRAKYASDEKFLQALLNSKVHDFAKNESVYGERVAPVKKEEKQSINDFTITAEGVLQKYTGKAKEIEIPREVKIISSYVFSGQSALTKVVIPDGVETIRENAFANCISLVEVKFLENSKLLEIGKNAFLGCSKLAEIEFPSDLIILGEDAFSGCDSLAQINLANDLPLSIINNVKDRENIRYNECDGALYLGNSQNPYLALVRVKDKEIETCVVQDGCKYICENAFFECYMLKEITIPKSLVSVESRGIRDSWRLETLIYKGSIEDWCKIDFNGISPLPDGKVKHFIVNGKEVKSIKLPSSMKKLKPYTFYAFGGINTIVLPNGIEEIGNNAISRTGENLKYNAFSIGLYVGSQENPYLALVKTNDKDNMGCKIHSDCKFILSYAFDLNQKIGVLNIPKNVIDISPNALSRMSGLQTINVEDGNPKYSQVDGNLYTADKKTLLMHPIGKSETIFTIPNGVQVIGSSAFSDNKNLQNVSVPMGVQEIGYSAFYGCKALRNVRLPSTVKVIGDMAFAGCDSLTTINIPQGVNKVGEVVFSYKNKTAVFCEARIKPEGWAKNWNYEGATVYWGKKI